MRILILLNHLKPGGIRRYVLDICSLLLGKGYKVAIGYGVGTDTEEKDFLSDLAGSLCFDNLRNVTDCLPSRLVFFKIGQLPKNVFSPQMILRYFRLAEFVRDSKPDLIWAHTRATSVLADFIWRGKKIPYIVTYHGFFKPNIGRFLLKSQGVVTVAVSNAVKDHLVKDLGLDASRIFVVYNAISDFRRKMLLSKVKHVEPVARRNLGLPEDAFVVGMLCRINKNKGYDLLLRALCKLDSSVHLILAGTFSSGKEEKSFNGMVKKFGIRNRVCLLELDKGLGDISLFWAAVDVFVMASYREGFGYTVLESMSLGIPVIVTNCGGPSEIIRNRETGIVVPVGDCQSIVDAINELKLNQQLYKKLSCSGRNAVEKFSFKNFTQQIEKVILKARGRGENDGVYMS